MIGAGCIVEGIAVEPVALSVDTLPIIGGLVENWHIDDVIVYVTGVNIHSAGVDVSLVDVFSVVVSIITSVEFSAVTGSEVDASAEVDVPLVDVASVVMFIITSVEFPAVTGSEVDASIVDVGPGEVKQ